MSVEAAPSSAGSPADPRAASPAPRSSGSQPARGLPRVPEWLATAGVGVLAALVLLIPRANRQFFYYIGDNPESFVPLWHHFGEQLRSGTWLTMEPSGWMGGNYAAEAAYALWNPVTLLNYVAVSSFTDLADAATMVMVEFLALLAMATYLLAREYGAARVPAAVVAVALPASGFTLYYEASGWPAGLMAFTWVTWFWWAVRRQARGRLVPLVPFVLGCLAMTTGNPYAALGLVIVLAGVGLELLLARRWRALVHVVVVGAAVGSSAALVFLPLLASASVSTRQTLAMVKNDTFLVPGAGDLLTSAAPSMLPAITNWGGLLVERVPSTYFMWFAVPLLPWLSLRGWARRTRPLTSLWVIGAIYALLTLGPSNLWLFRWPVRVVEYLYLALAVLLALALSSGLARDHPARRAAASAGIVAVGGYLSWAATPQYWAVHLRATLLVALLLAGLVLAQRRWGWRGFGALGVLGTAAVVALQSATLPVQSAQGATTLEQGYDVEEMSEGGEGYQGAVLQLAALPGATSEVQQEGELLFGNQTVVLDHPSLNRYTGIGFARFAASLCMDYRGAVCPRAYDSLWLPVGAAGTDLVDALGVSTLVLQDRLLGRVADAEPPPGWRVLEDDSVRTVWVREEPLPHPGTVTSASAGVEVVDATSTPHLETVDVEVPAGGGQLMFSRLAWPGYTATVDGVEVPVRTGTAGLVQVDLPAGSEELELRFESPGVRIGALALAGAAVVVLLQSLVWVLGRRRRDRAGDGVPA